MKHALKFLPMTYALTVCLSGCVIGGMPQDPRAHLSPTQCRDLTALKQHAPLTRERNDSELAALEEAGYRPSLFFDPYYPEDLQAAQSLVDYWYRTECQPGPAG